LVFAETLSEGILVIDLLSYGQRCGAALVLLRRLPPRGHGGLCSPGGEAQRVDEVNDYGALGRGEAPVP